MPSLPTVPSVPAVGDTGTASWADNVEAWIAFVAAPPTFVGAASGTNVTSGGSGVVLAFDSEEIDSAAGHDNVTNNSRYTAQYAGRYLCVACAVWPSNATGRRSVSLLKNGISTGTNYNDSNNTIPAATGVLRTQATRLIFLAVNDYVEALAFQDSGSTLNTVTGTLHVLWTGSS
jgi:hypothetical protein